MSTKIDVETSSFLPVANSISSSGKEIYTNYKEIGTILSNYRWKGVSYDEVIYNYNQNAIGMNKLIALYVKNLPESISSIQSLYEAADSVIGGSSHSATAPESEEAPKIGNISPSNTSTLTYADSNKTSEIKSKFANISKTFDDMKSSFGELDWESTSSEAFKSQVVSIIEQHQSAVQKFSEDFCNMLEAKISAIQAAESSNMSYGTSTGGVYTNYSGISGGNSNSGSSNTSSTTSNTSSSTNNSSSSANNNPTVTVTGSARLNGNVIDTSEPLGTGTKYNLSQNDLNFLAYVAYREQGSIEGAKIELSLMANLYEKNRSKYSSVVDYVANSGWFGTGSTSSYYYPGDSYVAAAKEVLVEGNRYLASNIVEHDCISDISSISTGSRSNRSNYIPGETVIYNVYGAKYVFIGFAPNGGDPFGYLV